VANPFSNNGLGDAAYRGMRNKSVPECVQVTDQSQPQHPFEIL
jgi:hypothetical protein